MGERLELAERPYHALSVIPDIDAKLLAGLASGKSLQAVANEYGVTDVAVLNRVRKHPDYKELVRLGLDLRIGKREMELEVAADNVSVTRADRLLGHARWLAERLDSETYGQRNHVTVEHTGDLGERLRRARERVIEAESVAEPQQIQPTPK